MRSKVIQLPGQDSEKYKIFPNPMKNILTVEVDDSLKKSNIFIYDLFGNLVFNLTIENSLTIPIDQWVQGTYIISINSENEILYLEKLVKL